MPTHGPQDGASDQGDAPLQSDVDHKLHPIDRSSNVTHAESDSVTPPTPEHINRFIVRHLAYLLGLAGTLGVVPDRLLFQHRHRLGSGVVVWRIRHHQHEFLSPQETPRAVNLTAVSMPAYYTECHEIASTSLRQRYTIAQASEGI